jgi:hypothetical protein
MLQQARALGANAVVGGRYDTGPMVGAGEVVGRWLKAAALKPHRVQRWRRLADAPDAKDPEVGRARPRPRGDGRTEAAPG